MLDEKQTPNCPVAPSAMHQPTPPHTDFAATLELPPVPFARTGSYGTADELPALAPQAAVAVAPTPAFAAPVAAAPQIVEAPATVGTSISELLDALKLDGVTMDADQIRPHAEFSSAVERRGRDERRTKPRHTNDRRAFASTNLAMPEQGPVDPRPQAAPPVAHVATSPAPIDTIMPELPLPLEPSRPYELPSRGVATGTMRTTRANVHVNELPFPATGMAYPAPPAGAPEPPVAPPTPAADLAPMHGFDAVPALHAQPAPAGTTPFVGIDAVFANSAPIPVGRLEPFAAAVHVPAAGPAGPAMAPGFGLDPVVAAVAAAPSAWHGGAVQVDDAMLVWNAPGTTAPLAPSVAAMISPAPPSAMQPSAAATPAAAGIATTALAPTAAAGSRPARGLGGSLLRLVLLVGVPAASGTGIAVALDRFVF
ncbi:MAG: hypothetical protein JWL76_1201 [Thermoleophilia bacterium]|nr:hypothetical protein [Thermoleophilia bacterium]